LVRDFGLSNSKSVVWDGSNQFGVQVKSGIYIYKISGIGINQSGLIVKIK